MVFYVYSDLIVQGIRHVTLLAQKRCGKPGTLHIAWYAAPLRVLNAKREWHSESESLGGGERKETRKKYDITISLHLREAVHGMIWAGPPKMMVGRKSVCTT